MTPKTVAFRKDARNVFFHILTRCNFRCRHCYINPREHGTKTLPVSTVETWLRVLHKPGKASNLILIGGEPTLHQDLPRMIRCARRLGYASITVDTNGTFCHGILDKTSPDDLDYFSVGLDGSSAEVNDRIRGKNAFKRAVSGMEKAIKKGFRLSLIYTVSRMNIFDLKNMPNLLTALGINRFFIQVVGIRGRSAQVGAPSLQVTRRQWASVVPRVARRAAGLGIQVTYPKVFLKPGERFECAGLVADNYFVFPNGRVYRCPLCEDFPLHSLAFNKDKLEPRPPVNESQLFQLTISEGCVMNKLVQPGNLDYDTRGRPRYQVACCLLKEEIHPQKT
ncbi:MAG: radical SAM protein [Deltaproteobacteria bacterium]|nr:radical SAM protein [Deltaproteobacteria bacterium]